MCYHAESGCSKSVYEQVAENQQNWGPLHLHKCVAQLSATAEFLV